MTSDEKIKAAFDALMAGRPQLTDGQLTVSNICREAGISRASFYRSPQAAVIRNALADSAGTQRPEREDLRAKVRELATADKKLRSEHAREIRDLRATVRTYANQIQIITLHASQLHDDNRRLLARLERSGNNVTVFNPRQPPAQPATCHETRPHEHDDT